MNLGLESDINNPNFAGAITNPDSLLNIEFYMFEPLDQHKSQQAGRRVFQTLHIPDGPEQVNPANGLKYQPMKDTGEKLRIPYIRIMKPGDNTSILEIPVREDHKRRWPEDWLYFASHEGLIDSGANVPGWKIEEWPHINHDQEAMRNLKYLRFHTVEQIAGASDAQIQRLGMGAHGLREAAKQSLQERVKVGISDELRQKDSKIAQLEGALGSLSQQMEEMKRMLMAQSGQAQQKEKRG